MPVRAVQLIEQEPRLFPSQIDTELENCTEVCKYDKKKLKTFLIAEGITSIAEMDYLLRKRFEQYLLEEQHLKKIDRYILAYDRVKQYSLHQQMQTLSGRTRCQWKLENKVLFIPYHPDQTLAMEFDTVRNRKNMVWDFAKPCASVLKNQIFITLNAVLRQFKELRKREQRLSGLQYLYHFCAESGIEDIEKMEQKQVEEFESYLEQHTDSESRRMLLLPILGYCRETVFLQNETIHWDANIWYLERMRLPEHRVNPSSAFVTVSFIEITMPENRRYAQEFMKYQIGITGQSLSTIVIIKNSVSP